MDGNGENTPPIFVPFLIHPVIFSDSWGIESPQHHVNEQFHDCSQKLIGSQGHGN